MSIPSSMEEQIRASILADIKENLTVELEWEGWHFGHSNRLTCRLLYDGEVFSENDEQIHISED